MRLIKSLSILILAVAFLGGCSSTPSKLIDHCIVGNIGAGTAIGGAVGGGLGAVAGFGAGTVAAAVLCNRGSPIIDAVVMDSDGDGVNDNDDACPNTPQGVVVDSRGCPRDDDGDGVANHLDRCPGTPRGVQVDSRGCPRDDDNDGVANHMDDCPGTPRGVGVDARGCPEAGETLVVLQNINFAFDSAELDAPSRAALDQVAQILRQQNVNVNIIGHTDSTGPANYNQGLSERRAAAVRSYLVGQGISSSSMTSSGRGESDPVASNDTRDGRAMNRRVEFVVAE